MTGVGDTKIRYLVPGVRCRGVESTGDAVQMFKGGKVKTSGPVGEGTRGEAGRDAVALYDSYDVGVG